MYRDILAGILYTAGLHQAMVSTDHHKCSPLTLSPDGGQQISGHNTGIPIKAVQS